MRYPLRDPPRAGKCGDSPTDIQTQPRAKRFGQEARKSTEMGVVFSAVSMELRIMALKSPEC